MDCILIGSIAIFLLTTHRISYIILYIMEYKLIFTILAQWSLKQCRLRDRFASVANLSLQSTKQLY